MALNIAPKTKVIKKKAGTPATKQYKVKTQSTVKEMTIYTLIPFPKERLVSTVSFLKYLMKQKSA